MYVSKVEAASEKRCIMSLISAYFGRKKVMLRILTVQTTYLMNFIVLPLLGGNLD